MTKAHRYGLDIATVGEKHCCACVAQTVEFEMTDIVSFEKFGELLCRSVGIHNVSVFLGEDISEILPSVAKEGGVLVLMLFIFSQGIA